MRGVPLAVFSQFFTSQFRFTGSIFFFSQDARFLSPPHYNFVQGREPVFPGGRH